jgi:hypothetical protein
MKKLLTMAGILAIGAAGCIPTSIHPLYSEKDLVFEPLLVGVWKEKDESKENWKFEKAGEKKYRLITTEDDGSTGEFEVHALKLGGLLFLDLSPDGCGVKDTTCTGYYQAHLQPMHSFLKITQLDPTTLQISAMDLKWLAGFLKENPQAIRHEKLGGEKDDPQIILTASTPELQAFVTRHLKTPGAFSNEPSILKRSKPNP